jgi:nicotinamide-nucleotide amidase
MDFVNDLLPRATRAVDLLKRHGHMIAIAESSAGGLINAALLAVPGASACCLGGLVVYTYELRHAMLGISDDDVKGMTPSTEPYAMLAARALRQKMGCEWALAETGAAGPTGSRYGYPAGHACFALAGPRERSLTLETGSSDRAGNMLAFAAAGIDLLIEVVSARPDLT